MMGNKHIYFLFIFESYDITQYIIIIIINNNKQF